MMKMITQIGRVEINRLSIANKVVLEVPGISYGKATGDIY